MELIFCLEKNEAFLDCANGKMISRILTSVSQQEIERTMKELK